MPNVESTQSLSVVESSTLPVDRGRKHESLCDVAT